MASIEEFNKIWSQMGDAEKKAFQQAMRQRQREDVKAMDSTEWIGELISNVPSSTYQAGADVVAALSDLPTTAKTLKDLAVGTVQLTTGLGDDEEAQALASKVADFYAERYGSFEDARASLAMDPAGVLGDLATILGTGAALLPAKVSGPLRLAEAAAVVEPLGLTTQIAKKGLEKGGDLAVATLGGLTGTGGDAIREGYKAGRTGGEALESFTSNLRGTADTRKLLSDAKTGLANIKMKRAQAYKQQMDKLGMSMPTMDFAPIDKIIAEAKKSTKFGDRVYRKDAYDAIQKAESIINDWQRLDPSHYTPFGFDKMKQEIGDILEGIPLEASSQRQAITDIYNGIKDEIVKQDPKYAEIMADYTEASELIREIEKTLSLNKNAMPDTQIRKLQSIMRNNVNTNYGERAKLVDELESQGGVSLKPALAGQAMSSWTPRGIQGATTGALEAGYLLTQGLDPSTVMKTATVAAATSPRLIAETARATGMGVKAVEDMFKKYPRLAYIKDPMLRVTMYQAEEAKRQGEQR
jgi:hypothetical protein